LSRIAVDEERVSLLLVAGVVAMLLIAGVGAASRWGLSSWDDRLRRLTAGATPTTALLVLVAVLVVVLTPGDVIGRTGQVALRLALVAGAAVLVGAVLSAATQVIHGSRLEIWLDFVIPRAIAVVPAAIAVRFAQDALRGA
jgi:hypothetical protein